MTEINGLEKDRTSTEQKLLDAVGEVIKNEGFEKVGVNNIASKSGVSKVLIYRYFGSLDNLILTYLERVDFWKNFSIEFPKDQDLKQFLKQVFKNQLFQLKENELLKNLQRWELTVNNSITEKLKLKRESKGMTLITILSQMSKHPESEIASIATIISAGISYLVMFKEVCPLYNGIDLQTEKGWDQILSGIDILIDKWFDS